MEVVRSQPLTGGFSLKRMLLSISSSQSLCFVHFDVRPFVQHRPGALVGDRELHLLDDRRLHNTKVQYHPGSVVLSQRSRGAALFLCLFGAFRLYGAVVRGRSLDVGRRLAKRVSQQTPRAACALRLRGDGHEAFSREQASPTLVS